MMTEQSKQMGLIARLKDMRRRRVVYHFIKGWIAYFLAVALMCVRPFTFLHRIFPKRIRAFLSGWDQDMLSTFVFSLGRKAYIDQPCTMQEPGNYRPRIDAEEPYRLSEEDIRFFYQNGYLGPFTLCSPEQMVNLRDEVMHQIERVSDVYGFATGRDRHLDCRSVLDLISQPPLTERLGQLLGPNLLLWRSQVFLKDPGAPEVTWHQASTYLSEEAYKPTLFPPDRNRLFQLTTWLAFDDVDVENGCLHFVRGSHRSINKVWIGGKHAESFANAKIKLDYDIDPKDVVAMEMKAGQFVIFTERVVHGSPPNNSDRRRWGMAFRTVQPEVKVYDNEMRHNVFYLKEQYDLNKWGAVVLRGEDTSGINVLFNAQHSHAVAGDATV